MLEVDEAEVMDEMIYDMKESIVLNKRVLIDLLNSVSSNIISKNK
jgi:hypothetical protein